MALQKSDIDSLVEWIAGKKFGTTTNYTLAIVGDDLWFTKSNGLGGVTGEGPGAIVDEIESRGLNTDRLVCVAGAFCDNVSNHAEMCILAAVGEEKLSSIKYLKCCAPVCDFCKVVLDHYKIDYSFRPAQRGGDTVTDAASQQGWRHPFLPIGFGTQSGDTAKQLQVLAELNKSGVVEERNVPAGGTYLYTKRKVGNYKEVDFG
ncbi:hypothetical protein [Nonomuraea sp. SBT364]|uniref:hypothetical protein n=1 Tax=Nonomuraea sp. SBT364 TaxID=1580530 RepID=UPI00066E9923|nr:hypothetical protein [Nonomuraea sp. SBT364]